MKLINFDKIGKDFTPTPERYRRKPIDGWFRNVKRIPQSHGRKPVVWGFTLVEVMVATVVILVGVLGMYALVPRIILTAGINRNRFMASQLAREGIELVRNIRDSNWLQGRVFDAGLAPGDYSVQYDIDSLLAFVDTPLKIDNNGFYQYSAGTDTMFRRKVNIQQEDGGESLRVKAIVSWPGRYSPFEAEEKIYNWKAF